MIIQTMADVEHDYDSGLLTGWFVQYLICYDAGRDSGCWLGWPTAARSIRTVLGSDHSGRIMFT